MAGSWSAIEYEMISALIDAITEATTKSFEELSENVNTFYSVSEGDYHRTGQLKASPQLDFISSGGTSAIGQISINTGTQYVPAGRDTETIYHYAEDDGLIGTGGFWARTEAKIQSNLDSAVSKRFK